MSAFGADEGALPLTLLLQAKATLTPEYFHKGEEWGSVPGFPVDEMQEGFASFAAADVFGDHLAGR